MTGLNRKTKTGPAVFALIFMLIPAISYSAHNYSDALYKSIYFYGAQRCGDTKSWIHNACHLQDGQPQGADLTGGWHDCGDHPKFGQTNSYSAAALLMAYSYFMAAYEDLYSQDYSAPPPNGIPDVLDEVKIHTDYLLKAYTGGRTYFQTGNGDWDHIHFVEPAYQSTAYNQANGGNPRPGYYVTSGGSNCNGDSAAALALMSIVYRPYNSAYADQCLAAAINYYNIGNTSPNTVGSTGVGYTGPANWADDMCWAAIELYRATGTASYLTAAQNFYNNGNFSKRTYWVACYDHVEPFAIYELYKQTGTNTYLNDLTTEVADYKALMRTCGIGQYAHRDNWGSLRHSGTMALIAAFLHNENNNAADLDFVKKNVDFILGTHGTITGGGGGSPQGKSFIIGYENPDYPGSGWPQRPHHRAAFGKQASGDVDFDTEDTTPGSVAFLHTLTGALVGGPRANNCTNYNDDIGDYVANEVGIDYNAGFTGALAYIRLKYGTTPATATPTNTMATPTRTATRTATRTVTATVSSTESRVPSFTFTSTPSVTRTPSPNNTPVYSPTETGTGTPPTETATPTVTGTFTVTSTESRVPSSTQTATFSVTRTPSPVNTVTFTRTPSPGSSETPSFTATRTGTPNATPTLTSTPGTAPTPADYVIENPLFYPNPYYSGSAIDAGFSCSVSRETVSMKIRIYTLSFKAVVEMDIPGIHPAGEVRDAIPAAGLQGLAGGMYFYIIKGQSVDKQATSKPGILVLLK